jgi:hypothetical protein
LLVAIVVPSPPIVHATSPAEYREAVRSALATLDAAPADDAPARAAALASVSAGIAAVASVEAGSGTSVTVANPALRDALAAQDFDGFHAQVVALLAALDAAATTSPPAPDAREQLEQVLARPEFQPPEPGPLARLLQPLGDLLQPLLQPLVAFKDALILLWERFWRWLRSLLEGSPGASDQRWVFIIMGSLVVLGLAALIGGAFAGNVVSGAQVAAARTRGRPGGAASRARALALADAGDYRGAVRELYLATLLRLDERRLLRFRPDLTNREHLAAGQHNVALALALGPLVERFDQLWYSGAPVAAPDWRQFLALADAAQSVPGDHEPVGASSPAASANLGAQ